ncbi:MAG: cell surface protein SprA [Prevotellaceae bacterium]|nr:cell surface protein SprA [Prevotellaceae bacterium]
MGFVVLFSIVSFSQDILSSVQTADNDIIVYDTNSDKYLFYRKETGGKGYPYKILSKEEYQKERFNRSLREVWQRKRNEEANALAEKEDGKLFQTKFRVNNDAFRTIFGSDEININPQGSLEMMFGMKISKVDNPMTPPEYRRTISPEFDTRFQLNVTGNIGERIKLNFNYDPNATFDFETNLKIDYQGGEDDILQKIEAGNITMPLSGTLITGSQSLFGLRTDLRFGRLDISTVFSRQQGQSKTIEVRGGAQTNYFEIQADQYDANRHFFLSQYFRDNYEQSLSQLPLVLSGVTITKIEVWVTNKTNRVEDANARNVVAFMDLAEQSQANIYNQVPAFAALGKMYPANDANGMYQQMITTYAGIRDIAMVNSALSGINNFSSGQDYEKLERARRLNPSEYTLQPQLGYISLNTALNSDEVLSVAYEYTIGGQTYRVGELSTEGNTEIDKSLIVKLLKGTILSPKLFTWKLMMKNIYRLDAYNLTQNGFLLDIFYEDDGIGASVPYLTGGNVDKKPLISVLGLDNLNSQNDPYPDGVFDYINGITVMPERGRVIFPVLEPFGSYLKKKINNEALASKYVYQELYDSTLTKAQELAEKNKFKISGSFESESAGTIYLEASNVPEGSVVVTAGGVKLTEGVDYQVNYVAGTVTITNAGYLESGIPIRVSLENRELFNLTSKTLVGANLNYKFSDKFTVGGTIMHLSEKPLTQKVSYGDDPISNTIWGLNASYSTESRFLTKMVNALPFINTKVTSSFSIDAEFAQLIPGHARGIGKEGTVYVDDFEGAKSSLDLRSYLSWSLAGTPQGMPDLFPEGSLINDLTNGYNRARLAWYWTDPELVRNTSNTPSYMRQNPAKYLENHWVREIPYKELFPERQEILGTSEFLQTLNLNYYPNERGPYNYDDKQIDANGYLRNPKQRWAGIMRPLPITDFETANYDYIEFWVMDPFTYNPEADGGDLYINLGTISEDILRDGYKMYEQGVPYPLDTTQMIKTAWGYVPKNPALVNTFDNNTAKRTAQDVGLDGMGNDLEIQHFSAFIANISNLNPSSKEVQRVLADPSGDDYMYYRSAVYDQEQASVFDRYKFFNNTQGNSATSESTGGQNQMYTTYPDMEDINRDNTMDETESYYQYRIKLNPRDMEVGKNHISSIIDTAVVFAHNGRQAIRWYQFRIPLNEYERTVGAISDFKSIRYMRMYMRGFQDTTVLRFATLELVRSEWRKYNYSLLEGQEGLTQPEMPDGQFEVSVVNIEEHSSRTPVNYIMPPGVSRVIDPDNTQNRELNEQSMQIKVVNLPDGDARAVYKTSIYDMRMYRRLKMDMHAEALMGDMSLQSGDISVFVRIGSDLRNNYYEYEIPLVVTPPGRYGDNQRDMVWPRENLLDIELSQLTDMKIFRNEKIKKEGGSINTMFEMANGEHIMRVVGNPNLGEIKSILIGVRNPIKKDKPEDKGVSKSGIIWVNELRLSDFEESGGWAANMRMSAKLADFGNVAVAGSIMTAGFGGIEQKLQERSREDIYQYDIVSNFELGKFFPEKWGVRIPMFVSFSEHYANPLYDPLSKDVKYKDAMSALTTKAEKDSLRNIAQDFMRRKSINFTNMRIAPADSKPRILSIANLSLSFSFNEIMSHNVNVEHRLQKEYRGALGYSYNIEPKYIEPFKKIKFLQSKWLSLIRDFNINLVPNQFSFNMDIYRYYDERQNRNIAYPEAKLPGTYAKDFTWNRHYNLSWDLTRSLRLTYNATNIARIDEPEGMVNKHRDPEGYKVWEKEVWKNIKNFGRNVNFNHNIDITWRMPFNKIPVLDWVTGSPYYRAAYNWSAAPLLREDSEYMYDPGNTIGNSRIIGGVAQFSLRNLYDKSKFLKNVNADFDGRKPTATELQEVKYESRKMSFTAKNRRLITHNLGTNNVVVKVYDKDDKELAATTETSGNNRVYVILNENSKETKVVVTGKVPKQQKAGAYAGKLLARLAMSVRDVSIDYSQNESTILPGYKPRTSIFGLNRNNGKLVPGLDFVLGGQALDFIERAREYQWLTSDSTMISPFAMSKRTTLNYTATIEPVRDLRIVLKGLRMKSEDNQIYNITSDKNTFSRVGAFQITIISLTTAFDGPSSTNNYYSPAFENFNKYRKEIAWRLAAQRQKQSNNGYNPGGGEYPDGYSGMSPEVLIPAFHAAYTGKSPSSVTLKNFWSFPLPNWSLTYNGFTRSEFFKQFLRSGSITHNYTSVYSVNAYNQNGQYTEESDGFSYTRNVLNDFIPMNDIMAVSINESFSPLLGVNLGWKNDLTTKFEIVKRRSLGLSLANAQVNEMRTTQFTIGLGYFFREVPLIFKFGEDRVKNLKTDLRLTGDFTFSDDITFLRSLDETEQQTQVYQGMKRIQFKFSADYTISKNIMLRLFFDRDVNKPRVSAIPTSNTNFGFSVRVTLTQ